MIGKPEDQRTNQRRQHQSWQQTPRPQHFCQQRREQPDKADNPHSVHQQRTDDNRQRQRRQTRKRQGQPEIARHAIIKPHQG